MSSDNELHCNNLKCRVLLGGEGKAVVTNCSRLIVCGTAIDIFCIGCANRLFNASQTCPACETSLTEPDDIVICSLNPTTDYKSSIMAGLSPAVILEIATRAMSFWSYQTSQESAFQEMVLKNAQERLADMERQVQNLNGELHNANTRLATLSHELDTSNRKAHDLAEANREREREWVKLRGSYDKLKRKHLLGPAAASVVDAVNDQAQQGLTHTHHQQQGGGNGMRQKLVQERARGNGGGGFAEFQAKPIRQAIPATPSTSAPQAFHPPNSARAQTQFQPAHQVQQPQFLQSTRKSTGGFGEGPRSNGGSDGGGGGGGGQRVVLGSLGMNAQNAGASGGFGMKRSAVAAGGGGGMRAFTGGRYAM